MFQFCSIPGHAHIRAQNGRQHNGIKFLHPCPHPLHACLPLSMAQIKYAVSPPMGNFSILSMCVCVCVVKLLRWNETSHPF